MFLRKAQHVANRQDSDVSLGSAWLKIIKEAGLSNEQAKIMDWFIPLKN